jgi:aminoglycoside phosphotransferase family enzyme
VVVKDVAHLAKDCDFRRMSDFNMHFISAYMLQGKNMPSKGYHYLFFDCYKACVRIKVSLFRSKGLDKTTILMMEKNRAGRAKPRIHLGLLNCI